MPIGLFTYHTKSGPRWGAKLKLKGTDGIWRRRTWRGFESKYDAQRFLEQQRAERYRLQHFPGDPQSCTVAAYFEGWLRHYVAPHCKFSTATSYQNNLNAYLLPVYGDRQLSSLTIHDMQRLCAQLQEAGKKRQTIRNIFTPIREALSHAVAEGVIPSNPCVILQRQLKQTRDAKASVNPLTPQQTRTLLNAAYEKDQILHAAILLGVRAGMRAGEVLGLQWGDVDYKKKQALLCHAMVRRRETTLKNKQIRVVDFTPSIIHTLKALPHGKPHERIIQRHGRGVSLSWLEKAFDQCLLDCRLPRITFHTLRHSYASQLIQLGANMKYIQCQLGHSSINVTMDIYSHLYGNERAVDLLERPAKVVRL